MKIIPAIDLQGGKCVRLFQGDFAQATEYSSNPVEIARQFASLSTTDLHLVDLDGARSGTQENRSIVKSIAGESSLSIQLGGGIRSLEVLSKWFDCGVARCVIGSLAITEPEEVMSCVLALDVNIDGRGTPVVTTHGWTRASNKTLFDCLDEYRATGLEYVLCTDVSRDGAMVGPNMQLYRRIMERYPDLQLQASGGVRNIGDLETLRKIGVPAAITGRALLEGKILATEIATFQQSA
jgi:phosphoribosylformimino-5-aminoimidazole carboxamide ribotide isomerase